MSGRQRVCSLDCFAVSQEVVVVLETQKDKMNMAEAPDFFIT